MKGRRFLALTVVLTVSLAVSNAWGKGTYTDEETKTIIANSIKEIQAFYPGKTLHVTVKFNQFFSFSCPLIDKGTEQAVQSIYYDMLNPLYGESYNVSVLKCFNSEDDEYDLTLDFTFPCKGMIRCVVFPFDRIVGILGGASEVQDYLIRFDAEGRIFQVTRSELIVE